MNHLTKLMISIVLAAGAAYSNAMWLKNQTTPELYIGASVDLPAGSLINEASLKPIPVPGEASHLQRTLVPFQNRSLLVGSRTVRPYRHGDLFFHRDFELPDEPESQWEVLGPFRVVAVGSAFKKVDLLDNSIHGSGGNNITIAVADGFDEKTRRLHEVLDAKRRITAVQVIPSDQPLLTREALKETEHDVLHQTIALDGIEHVPTVLYDGEVIRFILPKDQSY